MADSAAASDAFIYYVDDTLDGVNGTLAAADVVLVGTMATGERDTLTTATVLFV